MKPKEWHWFDMNFTFLTFYIQAALQKLLKADITFMFCNWLRKQSERSYGTQRSDWWSHTGHHWLGSERQLVSRPKQQYQLLKWTDDTWDSNWRYRLCSINVQVMCAEPRVSENQGSVACLSVGWLPDREREKQVEFYGLFVGATCHLLQKFVILWEVWSGEWLNHYPESDQ